MSWIKTVPIIDLNKHTWWIWKDEYFERISSWAIFEEFNYDWTEEILQKQAQIYYLNTKKHETNRQNNREWSNVLATI